MLHGKRDFADVIKVANQLTLKCPFFDWVGFFFVLAALSLHCYVQASSNCGAQAFSVCGKQGYSSLQCTGFSLQWLLLLQGKGSRQAGFSSCGTQAQ